MAFGNQSPVLIVDDFASPASSGYPQRTPGLDHIVNELLGDRGIAVARDWRLGAVRALSDRPVRRR
jgi:hypothetical protein